MSRNLEQELRTLRASRTILKSDGTDAVLTYPDGSPVKPNTVSRMMERAVRRCGAIPVEKKDSVTFHVLRHTFASLAAQSGISLFELQKLLGHSTPAMTARYAHFFRDEPRVAVNKLGQVLSNGGRVDA